MIREAGYESSIEPKSTISVKEYITLREGSLEKAVYNQLLEEGVPDHRAYGIVRRAFLLHRATWDDSQSADLKDALTQIKLPNPKPLSSKGRLSPR